MTLPLCAICECAPAAVDALWDHEPVRVCVECFEYETGERELCRLIGGR